MPLLSRQQQARGRFDWFGGRRVGPIGVEEVGYFPLIMMIDISDRVVLCKSWKERRLS